MTINRLYPAAAMLLLLAACKDAPTAPEAGALPASPSASSDTHHQRSHLFGGACETTITFLAPDPVKPGVQPSLMVTFHGSEVYHGGTGRFTKASGSAHLTGSASLTTQKGQTRTRGTLRY